MENVGAENCYTLIPGLQTVLKGLNMIGFKNIKFNGWAITSRPLQLQGQGHGGVSLLLSKVGGLASLKSKGQNQICSK